MKNQNNGTIQIDGREIHYETAGRGRTIVLGHAGFVDGRMWEPQWRLLSEHYRVVRYDLSGFGKSVPASGPVSRRADLLRLFDFLEVDQAALVGCSMSGEIALDFALENPLRISGLVLISTAPGGFPMQGEPPADLLAMLAALQQGDLEAAAECQLRLWVDGPFRSPQQSDPGVRRLAAEMNRIPLVNGTWAGMDARPLNPLDPPAWGRLEQIAVPTLVLAGSLDHPEILRAAQAMAERIPGARKIVLPDCAHLPNLEKPIEFNRVLLEFLARIPE